MKYVKIFAMIMSMVMIGCTEEAPVKKAEVPPLIGTGWILLEVITPEKLISLNRPQLEAEGMGDVFTLQFEGETRAFGKGAPNRYNAPCEWGDDFTLSIGPAAATLMMAFKEPEPLKEREFFDYLARVTRYARTAGGGLELYTAPDNRGQKTVLVFGQGSSERHP